MKFKFLKAAYLSALMAICSNANAGLITGTDIEIEKKSVSYIEFALFDTGVINWSLTGLPDGQEQFADIAYHYALFDGSFGSFGSLLVHDTARGLIKSLTGKTLDAGIYTFAVGISILTETEARTGFASTPFNFTQLYNFSLSGDTLQTTSGAVAQVPEPTTLAIFALGVLGLASRKFKKNI